ncbi:MULTISPECIES: KTSC domain-containing protein [unclassified Mesorhizobium]|uniref:KTSC domain-containing protein n=1 Tax=unclassified Mesorhizobium TaxID=325217 RepID=UPI000F75D7EB|nr:MULTISPECIES: KTSC domain-containing protein [unclassified Mesorhizobium]AZO19848.1 KTSC domain-containing protein [Mesorhizobium sp. M1E.F.Ca.ET.045.02.1.1]RUW38444.1 KTSC domain-containing protein [Mesorhizobium sp. M1E.F.Ca.ET.041.01.1.1]RUW85821.1 KTSC domain-containing protein [Mesorhizobium sp. M1E.F.Ca.ET.063.01.1.1]RWB57086.1 MAG: KTSC domain-containing protein [Mesorhizobium sp.]RWD90553.1 MAG: KTSC domain-containing protein [Mesorhizobium sp.]
MPSTSISKTAYDRESRTLPVWFVATGKRYDFEGVPTTTFAALDALPLKRERPAGQLRKAAGPTGAARFIKPRAVGRIFINARQTFRHANEGPFIDDHRSAIFGRILAFILQRHPFSGG